MYRKYIIKMILLMFIMTVISCEVEMDNDKISPETTSEITDGYVLYSFLGDYTTHLIDTNGNDLKTWTSSYRAVGGCYLSSHNTLLRSGSTPGAKNGTFASGGATSGIIEELDDNGTVIWSIQKDDDNYTFHHDFKEIDENTIITLAWNLVSYNNHNCWNEKVLIIDKESNTITWEWSALDNGGITPSTSDKEDYIHLNSVDYKNGSILVSSRSKDMLYLIDKESKTITSVLTAEGTLSGQHDAGFLDNGNILVFNNNAGNKTSAVIEINPYDEIVWEYSSDFYSSRISGAQRLESGNTIICSGDERRFIEITGEGETVWNFSPISADAGNTGAIFKIRKYPEY